jgi:hypothetical protein
VHEHLSLLLLCTCFWCDNKQLRPHYKKGKKFSTYWSCMHPLFFIIIKYLRYSVLWLVKVCNMSVYIRGQRFSACACTFRHFKIFYKSNMKWLLVTICWSQRNTWLSLMFLLNFLCALQLPMVFISQHITCYW